MVEGSGALVPSLPRSLVVLVLNFQSGHSGASGRPCAFRKIAAYSDITSYSDTQAIFGLRAGVACPRKTKES